MSLKLYKRGEIWHYRGTVAKRRLRGSTETSDETIAKRIRDEAAAKAWKGKLDGPASVLTFAQAAIRYLDAQKSPRYVAFVAAHWKDTPVHQINAGIVRQAAIALLPDAAGATRNRKIIVPTQAIINHSAESELCARLKVKRFKVVRKQKKPITWAWLLAFMLATDDTKLAALACFMFLTGARISEALDVKWGDIQDSEVIIRMGKLGGQTRLAHMPPPLMQALEAIQSDRLPNERVFGYEYRHQAKYYWHMTCLAAGIEPLSFHACRHGFATGLLHKGVDPITVAKLGGWQSPAHVFGTYGHAMDDATLANRLVGTELTQPDSEVEKDE